ncbi:MAG: hypothetical protein RIR09_2959 [Pseudomonadota bacterium]|jgi:thiosulfate/3-mercaptopyruvate sulfurtransferase
MPNPPFHHAAPPGFRHDLVRWQHLVSVAWLAALLASGSVAAQPAGTWRLLEVGCDDLDAFLCGHIPGASYMDTAELEQEPLWNKVPDATLVQCLLDHGIRHDTTVIVYGRCAVMAARAAHLMLYAGVHDVRLLDGGLSAWCLANLPLSITPPHLPQAASNFGVAFPAHPKYLSNTLQARHLLQQPNAALVSIRTWNEYMGKTSGYSYIDAVGDIAGARWGHAGKGNDVNSMSDFQHADGTMRSAQEVTQVWNAAGIHSGQQIAFYCGTGWRASLAFFYAWLMGWEHISVYDGGWYEWSLDRANPVICRSR